MNPAAAMACINQIKITVPEPTRFVRKPRDGEQARMLIPRVHSLRQIPRVNSSHGQITQSESTAIAINRSQYNRHIGDGIRAELEFDCNDLPTSDQIVFEELLLEVSEKKSKAM